MNCGVVIRQTSPDTGITDYVRESRGLVTQMTNARGIITQYAYDDAGRRAAKTFPSAPGENITYSYDSTAGGNKGVGRLTSVTRDGVAFTYDARGNVTREVRTIAGLASTISYTYDVADRVGVGRTRWSTGKMV